MRVWGAGLGALSLWPPDLWWLWQSAVAEAMRKGCRALGRAVGKVCKRLVNKYQDKISEALQNGDTPQDICTAMGICRS